MAAAMTTPKGPDMNDIRDFEWDSRRGRRSAMPSDSMTRATGETREELTNEELVDRFGTESYFSNAAASPSRETHAQRTVLRRELLARLSALEGEVERLTGENKALQALADARSTLLACYRTGSRAMAGGAIDRARAAEEKLAALRGASSGGTAT